MVVTRIVSETSLSEGDVSNIRCSQSPENRLHPKQKMRDAANSVNLSIDRPKKERSSGGSNEGGEGSFG